MNENGSEKILLDEQLMWYKKKLQAFPGRLLITAERISFVMDFVETPIGGIVATGLDKLRKLLFKDGVVLDDRLENVTFSKGKSMGKRTYILEIRTNTNDIYKFMFGDELLEKIKDYVALKA